jgi:hypothetical protein
MQCPPHCDNPSPVGAFAHYKLGSGKPLTYDFNRINTEGVRPSSFSDVKAAMSSGKPGAVTVDAKLAYQVPGAAGLTLGSITLRAQGTVTTYCVDSCVSSFEGTLKAYDDTYDFDKSTHRSQTGEALTTVGRKAGGTPYQIEIKGERTISELSDTERKD